MEKKLDVKNLTISFRTPGGKVQAVRDISFDLYKGETLAIVGESGSGKSVTSKAILGILAGNSIVEDGSIIYDGMDLLRISEDDFYHVRGDKIAMIFQDPLSSLNPITRIGKQLTEAMLLKGKARQKECRAAFNGYLARLKECMIEAEAKGDSAKASELSKKCADFDKFEYKHLELEGEYNKAHEACVEAVSELDNLIFELEKKSDKDANYRLKQVRSFVLDSRHQYVVNEKASEAEQLADVLLGTFKSEKKNAEYPETISILKKLLEIEKAAQDFPMPNFFSMGYYLTFAKEPLPQKPVPELNAFLREYLDNNFMLDFISNAKQARIYAADVACENRKKAIELLKKYRAVFEKSKLSESECRKAYKELTKAVMSTIERLEIVKDSQTYTFGVSLKNEIDRYFIGGKKNGKEQKRFEKQTAKHKKLVDKGKAPEWAVVPAAIVDLELTQSNMLEIIDNIVKHFENLIAKRQERDFDAETVETIDYLKACASGVVNKVTKNIAKNRAIKLMGEVGIPEPRKRYRQYPFEFSGGMRQRIVIAIALAADPDILICDEPTTALDVTIQAQILELINKIKAERNLSIIFITHDLGVVANMADRIAVMYAGKIVEIGTSEDVFYSPAHPYTWALLSAMPDVETNQRLEAIPGTPPNMIYPPKGDAFAERNKYALKIDFEMQPPMFKISDTHSAATWMLHEKAPKVEMPAVISERIARMKSKGGKQNG